MIFINEIFFRERFRSFLNFEARILPFLTTFTQLTERLKKFLRDWLLVLGLNEGLVECATLCAKPGHFCKLDVATSRMAFLDFNLHVLQVAASNSNN